MRKNPLNFPWYVSGTRPESISGAIGFDVYDCKGFEIAEVPNTAISEDWEERGLDHWSRPSGYLERSDADCSAIAHMIAAAPEMLEALDDLIKALTKATPYRNFSKADADSPIGKAISAVHKAKGRS